MASSLRLAVLKCDTPMPSVIDVAGDYQQIFQALLQDSLTSIPGRSQAFNTPDIGHAPVSFTLDAYDVVTQMEYPPDDVEYDGLLISGSAKSAYENLEWIDRLVVYVRRIISEKPKMKIFGICFGHQIVARALGESCVKNRAGWEVAVTRVQLSPLGKAIFGSQVLDIQQMHQDHVPTVPPNAYLLGSTTATPNQGMVVFHPSSTPSAESLQATSPVVPLSSIHILTLQGHPEFTPAIVSCVVDARRELLGEQLAADAKSRVGGLPGRSITDGRACDGVGTVGKVMWGILGVA
ncbi:class I glutamine amidotransferase-like protein [Phlebopus sp. FC_14]|nr:class I glutamine amidotransferase-like protein [Phlebopus sp. FC_14]